MLHAAIGDPIGGLNGAAALLLGFMQQRNTGEGQHIDLSQVECMLPMVAPSILEQSATGATSPRLGNRHPQHVPNGCFPTLGIDQWLTMSVRNNDEWKALCGAMRRDDLASDPALATAEGRREHEDSIEVAIRHWLADVRPDIAMVTLQKAGVQGLPSCRRISPTIRICSRPDTGSRATGRSWDRICCRRSPIAKATANCLMPSQISRRRSASITTRCCAKCWD
jgi:crotonobetainyl-CoA:carnitine CoA-transferase CaiB-like acyl-CoA transferase